MGIRVARPPSGRVRLELGQATPCGSRTPFPATAAGEIEEWVDRAVAQGIGSVIVLTSNKELAYYDAATARYGGLLGLYEYRGLKVGITLLLNGCSESTHKTGDTNSPCVR